LNATANFPIGLRFGDIGGNAEIQDSSESNRRFIMAQQYLFPHEVRNPKPAQRAAGKIQAVRPADNTNHQTGVPRKAPAQPEQLAKPSSQFSGRKIAASAAPHSDVRRTDSVRLFGWVGRYFAVRQTQSGKFLATFSIATPKPYRDESGNWLKRTVWQRIVAWGETAQSLDEQLRQGARVSVEGKFKTREWADKENNLHTTTELVARQVQFLDTTAA
jgi:single-strand DNA-binding protein